MTPDATGSTSWLAMLFFGTDIAARRALDLKIGKVRAISRAIQEDHSLDGLIEGIEDVRAEGEAAMGGADGA